MMRRAPYSVVAAAPGSSIIAAMEDAEGRHGPQTVSSGPVNYDRSCRR